MSEEARKEDECDAPSCRFASPSHSGTEFISGVVEGFYGRPWTLEQRKHLFARLNRLGLNTYVYAPKDDLKHRPQWREPYNGEEADILRSLIQSARANNIRFVYSLSPGIDIAYSKTEEIICIKSKLDQVRMLGCESFALLFDDIECEMNEMDRKCFSSFVSAQVAVTNEVYEYLGRPHFFFCPTEYCESRAVPSLQHSEYLTTLGEKLINDVHILWTGPRVISRHITVEHIRNVSKVLRRRPLIWDNLHANDYDQKRVFMGEFSGRPVALKKETAGLLMNPSSKYELNFVPLLTYADWNASNADCSINDKNNGDDGCLPDAVDKSRSLRIYDPWQSLQNAIALWADEFNSLSCHPVIPASRPECKVTTADSICDVAVMNDHNSSSQDSSTQLEEILKSVVVPSPIDEEPTVNSLTAAYGEPMETSVSTKKNEIVADVCNPTESCDVVMSEVHEFESADADQISLLVDMFYLPFECGRKACDLLEQFYWLHENALVMDTSKTSSHGKRCEWHRRFDEFQRTIRNVNKFFKYIVDCPNKPLVSELIPYVWDAHGSCSVLLGVARWMKAGFATCRPDWQPRFWNSTREDEPWIMGGGFLCECSKLVAPYGPIMRLFSNRTLLPLSIVNYEILPYTKGDLDSLVALSITSVDYPNVPFALQKEVFLDKFILPFLDASPQYCFMAQELVSPTEKKVICSVSAHPDARSFFDRIPTLVSSLKAKYDSVDSDRFDVDEIDKWYPTILDEIFDRYPAWLDARLLVDAYDSVPTKKLVQVAAAALFVNGCSGVFVTIPTEYEDHVSFYSRIGFSELGKTIDGRFTIFGHRLTVDEALQE
ncbi:putative hyaluronoglucosaminidase [Trichostrongylus colubriformis]|uniref:protein O-GlcNAcase n=1 Tax=Trichostrongylus colubriformis TaxID=6319 RepID=A0AAN8IGJ5_TRICO